MRTISVEFLTAQQASSRTPYIRIFINGVDYSSRLLFLEHHEELGRDWATIILNNSDRGLDPVATVSNNLLGRSFMIGYGYVTSVGNSYSEAATLWVKSQKMVSSPGQLVMELYCEGMWNYLREQRIMVTGAITPDNMAKGDPSLVGTDPYYSDTFDKTYNVRQLISMILTGAMGWTLNSGPSPDDGILTSFYPKFTINSLPYAAVVLLELIKMTKCYLRAKANAVWDIVYPQSSDAVNETYYSDQTPFFYEHAGAINEVVPNRIVVFANAPAGGGPSYPAPWSSVIVGDTGAYSGNYTEVMDFELAPTITSPTDAANRASALLTRLRSEFLSSRLIVPHDCRVELCDKVQVVDSREL